MQRISINNINLQSTSGPDQFGIKLGLGLEKLGLEIKINEISNENDINLVLIETDNIPAGLTKPLVLRLDGIWDANQQEFLEKNILIRKTYERADGIVFQSEFDKKMIEKHFGIRNVPKKVIYNGSFARRFDRKKIKIEWLENIKEDFDTVFVCAADWRNRPNKRLNENIRFVSEFANWLKQKCCLLSMGHIDGVEPMTETEHHKYFTQIHLGHVQPAQTIVPMAYADWFIHLAHRDHGPQVVCDAIAAQLPVICSSSGGTPELVAERGLIIDEQEEFNFEISDYRKPPKLQFTEEQYKEIDEGLELTRDDVADVHMNAVTEKYIEFFEEVISNV